MRILLFSLLILFGISGCISQEKTVVTGGRVLDGKYDSEFPSAPASKELNKVLASVKLINSLTFYKQFFFALSDSITGTTIDAGNFTQKASSSLITEKPASGSALIIYADAKKTALLTCAHTVFEPDTVIRYFQTAKGQPLPFIQRVDIKLRQQLNIIGLPRGGEVQIEALDRKADLAILSKSIAPQAGLPPIVFNYPFGSAAELDWGTFVYLIGFPHGKKMITTSIVSSPNRNKRHDFIINSTMYQGVSGGIILALRDGIPNFELVGLANALPAKSGIKLQPESNINSKTVNPSQPYTGTIYLNREVSIIPGITYTISVETVKKFIGQNKEQLQKKGFNF